MNFLIIDTSTERSAIGIATDNKLVSEKQLPQGYQSSKYLFDFLCAVVRDHPIEKIYVGLGPGSFTGVRVGVAAAKGLAFSRNIPLIGFNSLQGFVSKNITHFVSIIDAKMGGVYILEQRWEGENLIQLNEVKKISLQELVHVFQGEMTFISPNSSLLQTKFHNEQWTWIDQYPNLHFLAHELINLKIGLGRPLLINY